MSTTVKPPGRYQAVETPLDEALWIRTLARRVRRRDARALAELRDRRDPPALRPATARAWSLRSRCTMGKPNQVRRPGGPVKPSLFALSLVLLAGCSRSGAADLAAAAPVAVTPVAAKPSTEARAETPVDLMTSDRVREAILRDRRVAADAGSIRVSTRDNVVRLHGFVTTEDVRTRAASVARSVGGVARVENELAVDAEAAASTQQPMESVVDRAISDRVRLAFQRERSTRDAAGSVFVLTQDGVVRLTGTVASEDLKSRFGAVAKPVGSVRRVDNQLTVEPRRSAR
jgi:osmotically-inducible protein OsmY